MAKRLYRLCLTINGVTIEEVDLTWAQACRAAKAYGSWVKGPMIAIAMPMASEAAGKGNAMTEDDILAENAAFDALVETARQWATLHMDQWEKFRFATRYGTVYVTVSRSDPFPDDFTVVP